jgi:lipoprotein-releasing system permease protein
VAGRYLRGKRKSRFVSVITFISTAGVVVGVMALIVVMSVMTGFDEALRATIIGNRAHLTVDNRFGPLGEDERVAMTGNEQLDAAPRGYEELIDAIRRISPEVEAAAPLIQMEALLQTESGLRGQATTGAFIIGVDPRRETEVTQLAENLTSQAGRQYGRGELPEDDEIVLGYRLADRLGVRIGDHIAIATLKGRPAPFGRAAIQKKWVTVSGIAEAQMAEFDTLYAYTTLETAELLVERDGVDVIHFRLTDPELADVVAERIELTFPQLRATTWYESQAPFFGALEQEKVAMFIILMFIVLVAAFNITSTLIMVVMEKRRDIGILRTIGVSSRSVLALFVLEGLYIGLTGTLLGLVLGTLFAYNLNPIAEFIAWALDVPLFDSQIYYFDRIPVKVVWSDIWTITATAIVLTFISTLYPAWSAARLDPVEAMRYE